MEQTHGALVTDSHGNVLVVTPARDLGEIAFLQGQAEAFHLLKLVEAAPQVHLVFDLRHTRLIGSTALELLIRLWKRVGARGGRMIVCGASPHQIETMKITMLDRLWQVCPSREEALQLLDTLSTGRQQEDHLVQPTDASGATFDVVDEACEESFPASDPPARSPVTRV